MNNQGKPVLALDADGVIVDWFSSLIGFVNQRLGKNFLYNEFNDYNFAKIFGLRNELMQELIGEYDRSVSLADLPPVEGALPAISKLSTRYETIIITARLDKYRDATYEWFKRYLADTEIYFSIGAGNPYAGGSGRKTKVELAEKYNAKAMIDDNPHEFSNWTSPVRPICFAQPWNRQVTHVPRMDWNEIIDAFLNFNKRGTTK